MITSALRVLWQEEDGQDLVEYALLLAFIALAAVAILTSIQTNVKTLWNDISEALSDAVTSAVVGKGGANGLSRAADVTRRCCGSPDSAEENRSTLN